MSIRAIVTILSLSLIISIVLNSCTCAESAPITFFTTPFSPSPTSTTPSSPIITTAGILPPTTDSTRQHIEITMMGIAKWGGANSGKFSTEVWYTKSLNTGDNISGFVELTGQYYDRDNSYEWYFRVVGPGGKRVVDQIYVFDSDMAKNHYEFSFTASSHGIYKIIVIHWSNYDRNLVIEVQPKGWEEP